MTTHTHQIAARTFATTFASAVSEALQNATGAEWPLTLMPGSDFPTQSTQPVQFRLSAEGALRGECFVEFYEPAASALEQKLGGSMEEVDAAHARALGKVLSSAAAAVAASLSARHGEVTLRVDAVSGLAFGGMFVVPLTAPADAAGAPVLLYFDGALMSALSGTDPLGSAAKRPERAFHPSNLKLVMDVELNVSLRFGRRQLPLREVLELTSGSVIELDRMVDEPVELLLDGKVVARGEAVIVDGNYGLRVTEIPQSIESHFMN